MDGQQGSVLPPGHSQSGLGVLGSWDVRDQLKVKTFHPNWGGATGFFSVETFSKLEDFKGSLSLEVSPGLSHGPPSWDSVSTPSG